ncbi:MAG TPA: Spy/CpxP family protein refolding chaperone, partial [Gallionellaceae bacterium]|nr:Spy/CpxP family protein refolding chaperone [Gallionellaceae bacterium]
YGPGMMNGYDGGYGPGMMNGYRGGYGPGMMNGYRGGYGPGMMGGYGPGPGMVGGYGPGARSGYSKNPLGLTEDQQAKINTIQNQTRKSNWTLMGEIQDQQAKIADLSEAPTPDSAAIEEAQRGIFKLQQQMYQNSAEAHKKMDAVLTKEQKEKFRSFWQR